MTVIVVGCGECKVVARIFAYRPDFRISEFRVTPSFHVCLLHTYLVPYSARLENVNKGDDKIRYRPMECYIFLLIAPHNRPYNDLPCFLAQCGVVSNPKI